MFLVMTSGRSYFVYFNTLILWGLITDCFTFVKMGISIYDVLEGCNSKIYKSTSVTFTGNIF